MANKISDIDYDYLTSVSNELALVIAMAVENDWSKLRDTTYERIFTSCDWSLLDPNVAYAGDLRILAAVCLRMLLDIERDGANG